MGVSRPEYIGDVLDSCSRGYQRPRGIHDAVALCEPGQADYRLGRVLRYTAILACFWDLMFLMSCLFAPPTLVDIENQPPVKHNH